MYKYSKDLTAATIVPLILSMLSEKDHYGYGLINEIKEVSEGKIIWNQGTLYPLLSKLEDRGYITSYLRDIDGRQRKYYRIGEMGRSFLDEIKMDWLSVNKVLLSMWK